MERAAAERFFDLRDGPRPDVRVLHGYTEHRVDYKHAGLGSEHPPKFGGPERPVGNGHNVLEHGHGHEQVD